MYEATIWAPEVPRDETVVCTNIRRELEALENECRSLVEIRLFSIDKSASAAKATKFGIDACTYLTP